MPTASVETLTRQYCYGTIFLFGLVTVGALIGLPTYAYFFDYTWVDWAMFGLLYVITGLAMTVGYHRLLGHRSFDCPNWVKGCLLVAGGWALENSALTWAAAHIGHHAWCDEESDPYNAQREFWYSHVGWIFFKDPYANDKRSMSRVLQDPLVLWQHRYYAPLVLSGLFLPFVVGYLYNGWVGGLGCFLLAGVGRTFFVLNSTFCINSVCHLWGSQPHTTADSSRDSWAVSLLTFGEGYHNYHHTHQRDYRNGPRWYNFDPSKWLIFGLSLMGMARDLCRVQPERTRFVRSPSR